MNEAKYYYRIGEENTVICTLCPHNCSIHEGDTGYCRVRENKGGKLYSLTYGYISSMALDAIEKKPLKRFYEGKKVFSIGSYGCNFSCSFCQNYMISQEYSLDFSSSEYHTPQKIVEISQSLKKSDNIGIAYTYNESLINYEFILEIGKLIHENNMKNVLVTNGFINDEPLIELIPYIDAANIDLKGFSKEFYSMLDGDLEAVKRSIKTLYEYCHIEVTTLVIPTENDSVKEIDSLCSWLASIDPSIPLHLSRFFPRYKYSSKKPTDVNTLYELAKVAKKHLKYVYIGNV